MIAGERRFRSAKLADIKSIPAVVKQVSDEELLQLSLIENVQRENLTPVEEALAYKQLHDDYGFSQQEVAEKVSKSRSAISNYLRLLTLPKGVLKKIDSGVISFGHAKAILGCESQRRQEKIAHLIEKKGLSVRETENLVSKKERSVSKNKFSEDKKKSPEIKNIEEKLSKKIGTKIKISCGRKKGKVEIEFYSDKDLERIFDILMK